MVLKVILYTILFYHVVVSWGFAAVYIKHVNAKYILIEIL